MVTYNTLQVVVYNNLDSEKKLPITPYAHFFLSKNFRYFLHSAKGQFAEMVVYNTLRCLKTPKIPVIFKRRRRLSRRNKSQHDTIKNNVKHGSVFLKVDLKQPEFLEFMENFDVIFLDGNFS